MGLYIPGVGIPVRTELKLFVYPSGQTNVWTLEDGEYRIRKAANVPGHHGPLVDLDAVMELVMQYCPDDDGTCSKAGADLRELLDEIENIPVVIQESEGNDE